MLDTFFELFVFSAKTFIIVAFILLLIAGILALLGRGKVRMPGKITIKNLNDRYKETKSLILEEILSKKQFKQFLKETKKTEKNKKSTEESSQKNIFVINFNGDIKASAVAGLREEVTAILGVAKPQDEVVVRVESAGGMVHAYGLAAAQLQRFQTQKIPLTVIVDKVAASGGYLMACVADKILAAPFAIIGSIGVVVQLPNFNRLLKENNIDFEQLTAGGFKRTLTVFGHNTEEGREKMQQEINEIHGLFKNVIEQHRKQIDINKVSTGEYWLGSQAIKLNLVDELTTSDDYLLAQSKHANLYEVCYELKKSLGNKLSAMASLLRHNLLEKDPINIAFSHPSINHQEKIGILNKISQIRNSTN